jgi:hypothetical protein
VSERSILPLILLVYLTRLRTALTMSLIDISPNSSSTSSDGLRLGFLEFLCFLERKLGKRDLY